MTSEASPLQETQYKLQVIKDNIDNEPPLANYIKPYDKMNYDWETDKKIIQRVGIDAAGDLLAYCRPCKMYYHFEEMSIDAKRGPYGIKQNCKGCENKRQRDRSAAEKNANGNGVAHLPIIIQADPVADASDRAGYLAALEEIWNKAPQEITFDGLAKSGLTGKHFIYIVRWFGISNEVMKDIEERTSSQSTNAKFYYVGQTNGNDLDYNGSGSDAKIVKDLTKNDPNVREEIRIIEIVDPAKVNEAEYLIIRETGALKHGLNILPGNPDSKKFTYKLELDFSQEQHMDYYFKVQGYSQQSGKTFDEVATMFSFNGVTAYHMFNNVFFENALNGDILPMMNLFDTKRR